MGGQWGGGAAARCGLVACHVLLETRSRGSPGHLPSGPATPLGRPLPTGLSRQRSPCGGKGAPSFMPPRLGGPRGKQGKDLSRKVGGRIGGDGYDNDCHASLVNALTGERRQRRVKCLFVF